MRYESLGFGSLNIEMDTGRVLLSGSFDANFHRQFSQSITELLSSAKIPCITLDFNDVVFMDSSGLGMLLELSSKCAAYGKALALENCHGKVKYVLDTAHFGQILTIR